jgi:hypothetical protein
VRGLWEEYKEAASQSRSTHHETVPLLRQVKDHGRPDYLAKFRERLYADEQDDNDSQDEYDRYISPG